VKRNKERKPRPLDLILTCTGRTASGFYAQFMTSAGIPCGHEKIFNPYGYENALKRRLKMSRLRADSSWEAAPWLNSELLAGAQVVHLIRHPKATIESWMKFPTERAPVYWDYAAAYCPRMDELEHPIDRYAHRYVEWNRLIERELEGRDHIRFDIAREPRELLALLVERSLLSALPPAGRLYDNRHHNRHGNVPMRFSLDLLHDAQIRADLLAISADYGYTWDEPPITITGPVIKAVVTTMDNVELLALQVPVLRSEPIDEIVIVNNGSQDGTREWLDANGEGLTVVHRENHGAGPGRNAGLDAAGEFDYVLMLDGGVLPAYESIDKMLTYLQPRVGVCGIGVEVQDLRTDLSAAWLRWTEHISRTYVNRCLSHTAYGLFRRDAWDGFRFCEEGPFGRPGWGADDNEMRYQWLAAGKVLHVVTCGCRLPYFGAKDGQPGRCVGGSVHAYRRQSGSWARLKRETGIAPWGEGSVYEQRCVWLQHHWPQFDLGEQRDHPWMTVVIQAQPTIEETAAIVQRAHVLLHRQKLAQPGSGRLPRPYSVILWLRDADETMIQWAQERHLRRHYGTTITVNGEILRKTQQNEARWAGDFRLSFADDWRADLNRRGFFYGYAESEEDVRALVHVYHRAHHRAHNDLNKRPGKRARMREISCRTS